MTRLLVGDAIEQLATLPDESVHCCITSPPYWGLRSYLPTDSPDKALELGAEKTPEEYVARLVDVFREVRRVLRGDGVCWLNLGDSYAANTKGGGGLNGTIAGGRGQGTNAGSLFEPQRFDHGLKPKDLCLIPYRVALALQADGWYLRSHVIWAKGVSFCEHYSGSVMPESVRDRPTSAHEAVFLLTKSPRYFWDADAVREKSKRDAGESVPVTSAAKAGPALRNDGGRVAILNGYRNLRNVWAISPRPYSGSHYAVFPPALVAPMLKAGCPAKVCAECGAPWVREVEHDVVAYSASPRRGGCGDRNDSNDGRTTRTTRTTGWSATCEHDAGTLPGLVLDPFLGSGTVAQVAQDYGRRWIGIDLDPRNERLIHKRTAQQSLLGRAR